jgi:uncharacterized iron-regulated membrane protein
MGPSWQEINGQWHSSHWWQNLNASSITAMFLLVALLILLVTGVLVHVIRRDGYGSRPAPRSHHDETAPAAWYDLHIAP